MKNTQWEQDPNKTIKNSNLLGIYGEMLYQTTKHMLSLSTTSKVGCDSYHKVMEALINFKETI